MSAAQAAGVAPGCSGYYHVTAYMPVALEVVPYTLYSARTFFQPMEIASSMISMMVLMFSIPFMISMIVMMMQPVQAYIPQPQQAQQGGGGGGGSQQQKQSTGSPPPDVFRLVTLLLPLISMPLMWPLISAGMLLSSLLLGMLG